MTKNPIKSLKMQKKEFLIDQGIWDHVTASVKPLHGNLKNRVSEKEVSPTLRSIHVKVTKRGESIPRRSDELFRSSSLPELSHNNQTGLDKRNAKKLKKGQHAIEGQLDLHGMTQERAYVAINNFIDVSYRAGKRCILVITGKGLKTNGSVGILRLAVPRWLNEESNRTRVLAFSFATQKDGGEGALYVMLKRKR